MRVLDLNNNYAPSGGGVRTYHERKLEFAIQHPDTTCALLIPADHDERHVCGNTVRYHARAVPLGGSGYRFVISPHAIATIIDDFAPDIIELGSPYLLPRLVRRADPLESCPTVGFYHSDIPDTLVRPPASLFGDRFGDRATDWAWGRLGAVYRSMTAVHGASEFVLEKLRRAGVRRLFHTPLGVDTSLHHPGRRSEALRAALDIEPGQQLVLYLGRLAPEKGLRLLFDAYPRFRDSDRVRLLVVGHGPLEGELSRFLARYPEVRSMPFVSDRTALATLYASADLYLALGDTETFSLSTAESLASGVPVVAPATGGAGEQVARLTPTLTFMPGDAGGLADAVGRGLTLDTASRTALQGAGASAADWSGVFDRIFARYERIIDAHGVGDLSALEADHPQYPH